MSILVADAVSVYVPFFRVCVGVADAVSVYVPFFRVCVGVADAVSIYALFFHVVSLGCYQFGAVDHVTKPDVRQFYLD